MPTVSHFVLVQLLAMLTPATVSLAVALSLQSVLAAPPRVDPCTKSAGVKWAAPADVRACLS